MAQEDSETNMLVGDVKEVPLGHYSMKILKGPEGKKKGAIILSQVDNIVSKFPFVKDKFYIIERRGWRGLNEAKHADIKLVEDLSFWDKTIKKFPNAICLDIGPADFIDTDSFKPLKKEKIYDGIQISQWAQFKRPELFIQGAGLLPKRKFLKMGHFVEGGSQNELNFRNSMIKLSKKIGANINFLYNQIKTNKDLPRLKKEMNKHINEAKIGILTTEVEGINRFKMECLSAGLPFLVPEDVSYPTKKHINDSTGILFEPTPEGLARAIEEVLLNLNKYKTREYILKNTGKKRSLKKLKNALKELCIQDGMSYRFEKIDWDGRNQSLIWGKQVFEELEKYSK
ncbi:glycosyltransferase [Candidatus Pacearchaeota archaeon]|nr:glycosyltransferase [Candidatus Pacearchaeota archaeon]